MLIKILLTLLVVITFLVIPAILFEVDNKIIKFIEKILAILFVIFIIGAFIFLFILILISIWI